MPKYSRTEKFAELRNRLASDTENNKATPELEPYQGRIKVIEDEFAKDVKEITNSYTEEVKEAPTPVETVSELSNSDFDIDAIVNTVLANQPIVETAAVETAIEETTVEEKTTEETAVEETPAADVSEAALSIETIEPETNETENNTAVEDNERQSQIDSLRKQLEMLGVDPAVAAQMLASVENDNKNRENETADEVTVEENINIETNENETADPEVQSFLAGLEASGEETSLEESEPLKVEDHEEFHLDAEKADLQTNVEMNEEEKTEWENAEESIQEVKTIEETSAEDTNDTTDETPKAVEDTPAEDPYLYINDASALDDLIRELEALPDATDDQEAEMQAEQQLAAMMNEPNDNRVLQDVLDGVNAWNKDQGNTTLDELPHLFADDARKAENSTDVAELLDEAETKAVAEIAEIEKPAVEDVKTIETPLVEDVTADTLPDDDEEFSNTVSMEVSKIFAAIKEQSSDEQLSPLDLMNAKEEPQVSDEHVSEVLDLMGAKKSEEHPVLTKALEDDGLDIKNIAELEAEEKLAATLHDTIPFVISQNNELEEDDEDSVPNKILNIVLGVLVLILIAVLGFIIYYILLVKGIL